MSTAEERAYDGYAAEGTQPTGGDSNLQPRAAAGDPGAGNLDKVRNILFGAQAREYEKRFNRLEERLVKESADMREELRMRFNELEAYIKREVEALTARLRSEAETRDQAAQNLARELQDVGRNFDRRAVQLDDQMNRHQRELREQILEQSKHFAHELRRKQDEITAALERESHELRYDKADRTALAAMFAELAMRLNNEFTVPGAEDTGND